MIRTFLVDDERGARDRLRHLLSSFGDVEVVGEAENGMEALQRIPELRPDLVFLDIQMPGGTGLDVARALGLRDPESFFVLPSITMRSPLSSCTRLTTC
jgi:YesN/AraC family two-component response regulator